MTMPLMRVLLLVASLTSSGTYCQTKNESESKTSHEQKFRSQSPRAYLALCKYAEGSLLGLVESNAFFNEFEGKEPPDDCESGGHESGENKN
jgi:hypothetical protein